MPLTTPPLITPIWCGAVDEVSSGAAPVMLSVSNWLARLPVASTPVRSIPLVPKLITPLVAVLRLGSSPVRLRLTVSEALFKLPSVVSVTP